MARRVFLHVGSPKTGTTFLQEVLWSQKDVARRQGLLLPLESFFDHFLATGIAIRDDDPQPAEPEVVDEVWRRLVAESSLWDGDVLVSHELFALATAEQAARGIAAFGADVEVHVVLTARDLVRQIPAEWQEHVKHRSTLDFADFVADLRREDATTWFWRVQDSADVLRRWGATLPPDRVHVVTVPPAGGPPGVLWQRFAHLLGLDPAAFSTSGHRSNVSLGYAQTELLRRVNEALGDRLPWPGPYPADVKSVFAEVVLARQPGTRVALTGDDLGFARHRAQKVADDLGELGVDVVGDIADLVPPPPEVAPAPLPPPTDDEVLPESIEALAGLLAEFSALRQRGEQERVELHHARERVRELERQRDSLAREMAEREAYLLDHPVRQLRYAIAERSALAGKARAVVRRLRSASATRE